MLCVCGPDVLTARKTALPNLYSHTCAVFEMAILKALAKRKLKFNKKTEISRNFSVIRMN